MATKVSIESIPAEIWWDAKVNRQSRKIIVKAARVQYGKRFTGKTTGQVWDEISYNRFESAKEPLFLKYSDIEKEIPPIVFGGPSNFMWEGKKYLKYDSWKDENGEFVRWLYYSMDTQEKEMCYVTNDWTAPIEFSE